MNTAAAAAAAGYAEKKASTFFLKSTVGRKAIVDPCRVEPATSIRGKTGRVPNKYVAATW